MPSTEHYYFIEAIIPDSIELEIDTNSREAYSCQGIEEFAIEEAKVDEILGERSYSGGDVPESVIDDVVDVMDQEGAGKKYYFSDKHACKVFQKYLIENFDLASDLKSE